MLTKPLWILFDKLRQWHDVRSLDVTHATGRRGEDTAHRYLQSRGLVVIARNWRSRSGLCEIDILGWERGKPDRLIVVEVKSRTRADFAAPDRNIDSLKQISLRRAAREYCRQSEIDTQQVRFDTVSIVFEPVLKIEHDKNAFAL